MLLILNNSFKCRTDGDDLPNFQFSLKLSNLRPVIRGTKDVKIPSWPETYAHVKEHQETWLAVSRPLQDSCPHYPPIRRMLLGVKSPASAPRIRAAQAERVQNGVREWSHDSSAGTSQFFSSAETPFSNPPFVTYEEDKSFITEQTRIFCQLLKWADLYARVGYRVERRRLQDDRGKGPAWWTTSRGTRKWWSFLPGE